MITGKLRVVIEARVSKIHDGKVDLAFLNKRVVGAREGDTIEIVASIDLAGEFDQ